MTSERFAALLEAYGAEIGRWPDAERLSAHAYAETAPEAGALLAEARAVDTLLAALPMPVPGAVLEAAILAEAGRLGALPAARAGTVARVLKAVWPRASSWKPASIFASAMALGIVLGANLMGSLPVPSGSAGSSEDVLAYAVPILDQDLN